MKARKTSRHLAEKEEKKRKRIYLYVSTLLGSNMYAGPNTNSRKVAEYGGNTLGYGSRSVLGTGWPKDLVKVPFLSSTIISVFVGDVMFCT